MRRALRFVAFLILLGGEMAVRGGVAEYTDRGKTDFDTAMELLNTHGKWAKVDGLWAYTPLNHAPPYTNGRWLYTEYGWYWKGNAPESWATEHYGYWKRNADHVWSWYPTPDWLPQIVEIRATTTHVGWRAAEVDTDGNFVEKAEDRFAKTDEWTFVSMAQFTGPITPGVIASPETAAKILDDSAEAMHTYVTYRPIRRPGPHPADFLVFKPDEMFAPQTENDAPAKTEMVMPVVVKSANPVPVVKTSSPVGTALSKPVSPGSASSGGVQTKAPASDGSLGEADDAAATAEDARQVPYWITMSLPSYWSVRPADAGSKEVYIYRPEFYQDQDGIERRVQVWLNPKSLESPVDLQKVMATRPPVTAPAGEAGGKSVQGGDAFHSPFDDQFQPGTGGAKSTKAAPLKAAPSGLGGATNAAPSP